jgi:ribosomal protein L29
MLDRLDGRRDLSAYDKMRTYSAFTKSLYPESSDLASGKSADEIMVRNYELARSFLEMDSVQSDLRGMSPRDRASYLRQLRLSLGIPEDAVRGMAEADAVRDRLWENGPAYNKERSEIMSKYDGEEREQRLDEARKKYFGDSAGRIKFEEDNFKVNRFQFPRRFGRD